MKKTLLPVVLLLFTVTISAQKKMEVGFQGGINLNSVYGTNVIKDVRSRTTGLSIGANAKWNTTDRFGIRVQLSYEQLGWAYRGLIFETGVLTNTKTDLFYRINYLNLPILAEYSFGKKVKLNIDAGVFAGLLLQNKSTQKTIPPSTIDFPTTITNSLHDKKPFNAGLAAGVGVQVPLSSTIALSVDVRNTTGLVNIYQSGSRNTSIKTLTYSFLSGLSFQL